MKSNVLSRADLPNIFKIICDVLGTDVYGARSKNRNNRGDMRYVDARQIFAAMCRKYTNCCTEIVGNYVNKNRSTMSTSLLPFKNQMETSDSYRNEVLEIEKRIKKDLIGMYKEATKVETNEYILLSIEFHGKESVSWEYLQRVKEKTVGDLLMVEVYPKKSNVVNNANVRHLYHLKGVEIPCLNDLDNEIDYDVEFF